MTQRGTGEDTTVGEDLDRVARASLVHAFADQLRLPGRAKAGEQGGGDEVHDQEQPPTHPGCHRQSADEDRRRGSRRAERSRPTSHDRNGDCERQADDPPWDVSHATT